MATFLMLGKYTTHALEAVSSARTQKAVKIIEAAGGKVKSIHVLLGEHDLAILADFSETNKAVKASLELTKLTGIGFSTSAAVPVEEFDKMFT